MVLRFRQEHNKEPLCFPLACREVYTCASAVALDQQCEAGVQAEAGKPHEQLLKCVASHLAGLLDLAASVLKQVFSGEYQVPTKGLVNAEHPLLPAAEHFETLCAPPTHHSASIPSTASIPSIASTASTASTAFCKSTRRGKSSPSMVRKVCRLW